MEHTLRETIQLLLNLHVWIAIGVTSVYGASLGLINYYAGKGGTAVIHKKFPKFGTDRLERIQALYERWGARMLLLSAVPVINTLVTLGAGMYRIHVVPFYIWSLIALLARNWLLLLFMTFVIQQL